MSDSLYWRLAYPDDHLEDEPLDNASILLSRPGAVRLFAMRPAGDHREPMFAVMLIDEQGERYQPIFYRRRSMSMDGSGTNLDYVVIGRGKHIEQMSRAARRRAQLRGEVNLQFQGKLWASTDGVTFTDAPQHVIDETALMNLILNSA